MNRNHQHSIPRLAVQPDVLLALHANKGPMTINEIVDEVFWGYTSVRNNLRVMARKGTPYVAKVAGRSPALWGITEHGVKHIQWILDLDAKAEEEVAETA